MNPDSRVRVKLACSTTSVVKGSSGVFFGTIAQEEPLTVGLRPCDSNGPASECDLQKLRTKDFTSCKETHTCSCSSHAAGSRWQSGFLNCYSCSCSSNSHNQCEISCTLRDTCIVGPAIAGVGTVLALIGCLSAIVAKRTWKKRSGPVVETELYEVPHPEATYAPCSSSLGSSSLFVTNQDGNPIVFNTHPMVMMTQTGEPVVVQVAYM
jgi:hypothetical protein